MGSLTLESCDDILMRVNLVTNKSVKYQTTTCKLKKLNTRIIEMIYKIEGHRRHLSSLPKGFLLFQLGKDMLFF